MLVLHTAGSGAETALEELPGLVEQVVHYHTEANLIVPLGAPGEPLRTARCCNQQGSSSARDNWQHERQQHPKP